MSTVIASAVTLPTLVSLDTPFNTIDLELQNYAKNCESKIKAVNINHNVKKCIDYSIQNKKGCQMAALFETFKSIFLVGYNNFACDAFTVVG